MKKANPGREEDFKGACALMKKYIGNIGGNPDEEKFRNIKMSNAGFQTKILALNTNIKHEHLGHTGAPALTLLLLIPNPCTTRD
eukprot:gene18533-25040_t